MLDKRQLLRRLKDAGGALRDTSSLNSVLYAMERDGHLSHVGSTPPRWYIQGESGQPARPASALQVPTMSARPQKFDRTGKQLYLWQERALTAWEEASRIGVVQAVTGTGKTQVGVEAAAGELSIGGKVLVIVPTVALLSQWKRNIEREIPAARVGLRGEGHQATFARHDIIVSTVHSSRSLATPARGLLVADECHRYGAESWFGWLNEHYSARLGLSATYERGDAGDARLAGFFGDKPVYDIAYRQAIDEGIVARFKLGFVGISLTYDEQRAYDEASDRSSNAFGKLVNTFGLRAEPFAEFMKDVAVAADGKWKDRPQQARQTAISFTSNFQKKRKVVAESRAKEDRLKHLLPLAEQANGTLIFTQTKQAAERAATLFGNVGAGAAAIYGGMAREEREHLLNAFRERGRSVLTAPRVLDEGIDVPDADLGIVLSASSSRRQMIQRMGRVLRTKTDHRLARIVILYAERTMEDPAKGAHESFIDIAWDVADEARIFGSDSSVPELVAFLT